MDVIANIETQLIWAFFEVLSSRQFFKWFFVLFFDVCMFLKFEKYTDSFSFLITFFLWFVLITCCSLSLFKKSSRVRNGIEDDLYLYWIIPQSNFLWKVCSFYCSCLIVWFLFLILLNLYEDVLLLCSHASSYGVKGLWGS